MRNRLQNSLASCDDVEQVGEFSEKFVQTLTHIFFGEDADNED